MKLERSFSPEKLADMWDMSVEAVYKLIQRKKLWPVYKFSHKCVRVPESVALNHQKNCLVGQKAT